MSGIYTVCIRTDFAAAHIIPNHPGKCARLHGHNWKVEVEAECRQLDHVGVGIDFSDLKKISLNIIDKLDHRHLNDIPPFDQIPPTAENVAAWLYHEIKAAMLLELKREDIRLSSITLFENDRCSVKYRED